MTESLPSTKTVAEAHARAHTYIQAFFDAGMTDAQRISDLAWASEAYLAERLRGADAAPPPDGLRTPAEVARKPRKPTLASAKKQASKAGIEVNRYEMKPDGTIVIITGKPEPIEANPWDEVLFDAADQKRPS